MNRADQTERSGAIAQLVERLNGIQEVSGSTPLSSTIPSFLSRCCLRFEKSERDEGSRSLALPALPVILGPEDEPGVAVAFWLSNTQLSRLI